MICEIMSIGTELLLGNIVDTNARFLSEELAEVGVDVYHRQCVGDNMERLTDAMRLALSRSDVVIATGGLGPTMDDITAEAVAKTLGVDLIEDGEALANIEHRLAASGRPMTANNRKQALVPCGAIVLQNTRGTAPGSITEKDGKAFVIMPGPPREMTTMFRLSVRPYIEKKQGGTLVSKTLKLFGIGESALEDRIKPFLDSQTNPTIALYVGFGEVKIRITAKCQNREEGDGLIAPIEKMLRDELGGLIYGTGDDTLSAVTAAFLVESGKTFACAESCTGGMIASDMVSYPGVSSAFLAGYVTYSNEAKMNSLGVRESTLKSFGAVSAETAREMALGARIAAGADIAVSTTGIAGPGGGTPEKPVGLVYIGYSDENGTTACEYHFSGDREAVRNSAHLRAIDTLRRALQTK